MSSTQTQESVFQLLQERKREIKQLQEARKKAEEQMQKMSAKLEQLAEQLESVKIGAAMVGKNLREVR